MHFDRPGVRGIPDDQPHLLGRLAPSVRTCRYFRVDLKSPGDVSRSSASVLNLGLFAKGGAGLGITSASVDYGSSTSETGFAWNAGVGYEIQVSKVLYITPQVGWYFSSYQKRDDDTLYERLFNVSLNVTFQPGR